MQQYLILHILKTAGTSFGQGYLPKAFPGQVWNKFGNHKEAEESRERLCAMSDDERAKIRVLYGHQLNVVADLFPNAKHMTFVRDPVRRAISQYVYERKYIEELKLAPRPLPDEIDDFWGHFLDWGLNNFHTQTRTILNYFGQPLDNLEGAKELLDRFAFIGLQNDFELSQEVLFSDFGFPKIPLPYEMVGKTSSIVPPKSVEAKIRELSLYDQAIFDEAKRRLERKRGIISRLKKFFRL